MTELEARQFIDRIQKLRIEFERICNCGIHYNLSEWGKNAKKIDRIMIELSLKIDK